MNMSLHEYRLIAGGWLLLLMLLTLFWYFTLRRLSEVLKDHLKSARLTPPPATIGAMFLFLVRADYKSTRDDRLIGVCNRLRQLLYGYLGAAGAYFVFLVICQSRGLLS